MTPSPGRYESDLKPLKRLFWIATALFLAAATIWATQGRSRRIVESRYKEHQRAESGLSRVREAVANRRQVLAGVAGAQPQGGDAKSPEVLVYGTAEEIKARLKPDEMTLGAIAKKEGETSLDYALTFSDPKHCDVLNGVGYLQRRVFPFTPVNSIAVSRTEHKGKAVVAYVVKGAILSPERSSQ